MATKKKVKTVKAKKEEEHPLAKIVLVGSIVLFIFGLIKKLLGTNKTSK